ncbi:taurine dioxygenase [Saccharopolyspora shandongensis]|uniref:Taurine dioxygenase n=1 Tax=Saccharopolyspora shandongensis TaxID=418495 RepID=A0A1H3R613_9PSEU|nr:TauD/TfdA family dioxygenase [Saccharopolyspora shandongensis]SDZ21272.1 taurine dioxygenase [Saccharopolyspora shandongensis]
MASNDIDVRPVSGALGAEVRGLDLEKLTEESFARLHDLLMENLVLFFPEADPLSAEAHKNFGRFLGELEVHPFLPKMDGHQEIVVLDSDQGAKADVWHTDVTFQANPPIASILQIVQCPPRGGDTMWSNQYLAYEALSAPLRDFLDGLTAVHAFTHPNGTSFEAEHPVVRVHPVTGRRSLYVNRMFTMHFPQLRRAESDALLEHLFAVAERPENICRFGWKPGGIAMWDNRVTQHYAVNDYTERRVGHRVTILGDEPKGDEPRWPHLSDTGRTAADFRQQAKA